MLVLTRKENESLTIANNVRVTVISIRGGRVQLGISAPPEVPVHREEVSRQIQQLCEPGPLTPAEIEVAPA